MEEVPGDEEQVVFGRYCAYLFECIDSGMTRDRRGTLVDSKVEVGCQEYPHKNQPLPGRASSAPVFFLYTIQRIY